MFRFQKTPETEAYRIKRLREALSKGWSKEVRAHRLDAFAKRRVLGLKPKPRSLESIEKAAAKLRGRKRPPEVVEKVRRSNLGKNLFHKHNAETRKKVSRGVKESWKNRSPAERERIRLLGLAKRGKKQDPTQSLIHSVKMWGRKAKPEHVEARAKTMRGRPQKALLTKKGTTNKSSLRGAIRSPDNEVYEFVNLADWVRNHEHLFKSEDVQWRSRTTGTRMSTPNCRASKGLINLFGHGKHINGSWKGWTVYSHVEQVYNNGKDLLREGAQDRCLALTSSHASPELTILT
jgi:hypothetical protein